ncbi:patatin-like phospholipase family protein [Aliivibrio kagoshimensis]
MHITFRPSRSRSTIILFVLLFSLFSHFANANANANANAEIDAERPKIGLVLAGGGAKGAAHIGVIKALEEMNIPVDYITGTSMGAFIGGLYASGQSVEEIEALIDNTHWNSGFLDTVERGERKVRDKVYEDRYQIRTDLGIGLDGFKAPKGVVQGQTMSKILRQSHRNLASLDTFDHLAIPFRAVATDIEKLEAVVIDHGDLTVAMMASMSVPGALPPTVYQGRLLVDGGIVNNMPVDVAKAMGADIIIAVDVGSDYKDEDQISSYLTVMNQLTNYMVKKSTAEQGKLLTGRDVLLQPNVGKMDTAQFEIMNQALLLGYESALESKEKLASLTITPKEYEEYKNKVEKRKSNLKFGADLIVTNIALNNSSQYSDELLLERLNLNEGATIDIEDLEASIRNLYVLDRFEKITYNYQYENEEKTTLTINVKEKSWGPNYLDFRFALEDDFNNNSKYSLGMSVNFTDINLTGYNNIGSEIRTNFAIGTDKLALVELYTPYFSEQAFFSVLRASFTSESKHYSGIEPTLESTQTYIPIDYDELTFEGAIGSQHYLWQDIRFGLRFTDGEATLSGYSQLNADYQRKGTFLQYRLDTLDDFSLPSSGHLVMAEYLYSQDKASSSINNQTEDSVIQFSAVASKAITFDRHTFVGHAEYGSVENKEQERLVLSPHELGGFMRLSGTPKDSLSGENLVFGSFTYRYKVMENDFGVFESPVYIGATLEYGGVWSGKTVMNDANLYTAGSLFAGVKSPIGPIILAYGRTEKDYDSIYLILGKTL